MGSLRGSAIFSEVCLYACLRYLAGGLYLDIKYFAGIFDASLYRAVWKCIDSINVCDDLTVKFPTAWIKVKEAARGFETKKYPWVYFSHVVDIYHLQIQTPSKSEVKKNVQSLFSGHVNHMASTSRPNVIINVASPSLVLLDLE